jgi:hypothetical protein
MRHGFSLRTKVHWLIVAGLKLDDQIVDRFYVGVESRRT